MDILKIAIDWAKAELVSTSFFSFWGSFYLLIKQISVWVTLLKFLFQSLGHTKNGLLRMI